MGIDARIQGEDGTVHGELLDPASLVARLLPSENSNGMCLRFIDPYGDTLFNQLQLPALIEELTTAVNAVTDAEGKAHGKSLLALIGRARDRMHTYVKFIGD